MVFCLYYCRSSLYGWRRGSIVVALSAVVLPRNLSILPSNAFEFPVVLESTHLSTCGERLEGRVVLLLICTPSFVFHGKGTRSINKREGRQPCPGAATVATALMMGRQAAQSGWRPRTSDILSKGTWMER